MEDWELHSDETLHLEGCILPGGHEGDCFVDEFPVEDCFHPATRLGFDDLTGEKFIYCLDCEDILERESYD